MRPTSWLPDQAIAEAIGHYIPESFREKIETRYYQKVNQFFRLENIIHNPFFEDLQSRMIFFSDHGVTHARNIMLLLYELMPRINGVLFPKRNSPRLEFMKGYGLLLTCIHDIGMTNYSDFGRAVHAELCAQEVFSSGFDEMIEEIWNQNIGGVAWRILFHTSKYQLRISPKLLLRELLALAYCHSKSAVSIEILNNKVALRERMQFCLSTAVETIYLQKQIARCQQALKVDPANDKMQQQLTQLLQQENADSDIAQQYAEQRQHLLHCYYDDFCANSYAWLLHENAESLELIDDVVDTLRVLRCADALRARGTDLKTSGNYQIFIDQHSANAVYAFKSKQGELFLVAAPKPITAAEANLASATITCEGDLNFSFFHGSFPSKEETQTAIQSHSTLIEDIAQDVIGSFVRSSDDEKTGDYLKRQQPMHILLETTEASEGFMQQLTQALKKSNPWLGSLVKLVPSLLHVAEMELHRYLKAIAIHPDKAYRKNILDHVAAKGHKVSAVITEHAFDHVRLGKLDAGEVLMHKGDYAGFVYIPLGCGLKGMPGSGYEMFDVMPWQLLGQTGVIRGDIRNSTVIATQNIEIIIIPKEIYLKYWHATYTVKEFKTILDKKRKECI